MCRKIKRYALCSSGEYPDINTIIFDTNNPSEDDQVHKWDYIDSFDDEDQAAGAKEDYESQATKDYYREQNELSNIRKEQGYEW